MDDPEVLARFTKRYANNDVPWDAELPPPEVIDLVARLEPGAALDLGCGYGRTAIYLAQNGWVVDGVDFVETAVQEARRRAQLVHVDQNVTFHVGSVANLHFLQKRYDCAVDVGCFHALNPAQQQAYHDELCRLLKPAAIYLLFARLRDEQASLTDENTPPGTVEADLHRLFADSFSLQSMSMGETKMPDQPAWKSGWFEFVKNE